MAFAGCGGTHKQTDQQRIAQVLRSYLRAQATGDGQTACALLTSSGQSELIAVVMKEAKGFLKTRPSCEEAVGLARAVAGQKLLDALKGARIPRVQVHGVNGSAEIIVDMQPAQTVLLTSSGGAWRITGVPGLAG